MLKMKVRSANSLQGTIRVPGDKSISHRAAILAAMADGETHITNLSKAADCQATLACLEAIGVPIRRAEDRVVVTGLGKLGFQKPSVPLDCGNSGTTARLLAGVLAGQRFDSMLIGDESLSVRPMERVIAPLRSMGAAIGSADGRMPISISGRSLVGIEYRAKIASAQVKSCVLLAGLLAEGTTSVIEDRPTRDHTELMLKSFGVEIKTAVTDNGKKISISGEMRPNGIDVDVPGDISSAAFFVVAAACRAGSSLTIADVGLNPTRSAILGLLYSIGAKIEISNSTESGNEPRGTMHVNGGLENQTARGRIVVAADVVPSVIDEIPALAVLGTQLDGGIEVRDAGELRHKETDRIAAMVDNLRRMNAAVEEFPDGFRVERSELKGAVVDSFGDHRVAMACAVAGLLAGDETDILNAACVDVSFPGFFDTLAAVIQ